MQGGPTKWLHADKDVNPVDHDHVEKELLQKFNITSTTNKHVAAADSRSMTKYNWIRK